MKVVTYNIHQGRGRTGGSTLDDVADALATLDADVIACQEVLGGGREGVRQQAPWLGERLGMSVRFAPNARTKHGVLGNATLSRRPITGHDNLDVSVPGFERRGVLRVAVDGPCDVWNLHFGLTGRQRIAQWHRVAVELAKQDRAVVICGDFNDWRGGLHRPVERAGMRSALASAGRIRRATFPARRPWFGLDRVYYRGLRLVGSSVLRGAPWSELSDHLPVVATFAPATQDGAPHT